MTIKTPLRKKRVLNHFSYGIWKYILLIALSFFVWNLVYTTTEYRAPEDKKVLFYVFASGADQEKLDKMARIIHENTLPDMEEVGANVFFGRSKEDPYGGIQLSVYVMAGEGDVYLLEEEDFISFAVQGAFLALDEYIDNSIINLDSKETRFDLRVHETDYRATYGIKADRLEGLKNYNINPENKVLCILYQNQNDLNSALFLNEVIQLNLDSAINK